MTKSRTRAKRRDRRRAKMYGWKRAPKQMGSHAGSGTSTTTTTVVVTILGKNSRGAP